MVKTPIPSTVLGEVAIDHGPEELLVPLFLRVENAIRLLGLRLSLVTFDTLLEINAANRDSWMPLSALDVAARELPLLRQVADPPGGLVLEHMDRLAGHDSEPRQQPDQDIE